MTAGVLHPDAIQAINTLNSWAAEHDRLTTEYEEAVTVLAEADIAMKRAEANAALTVRGKTVAEREAAVHLKLEEEGLYTNRRRAEAVEKAIRAKIANARLQIESARSNNAAVNTSLRESGPI